MTKTEEFEGLRVIAFPEKNERAGGVVARMATDRRRLRETNSRDLVSPEVRAQSTERWRVEDAALLAYEAARREEARETPFRMPPRPGYWARLWAALRGR